MLLKDRNFPENCLKQENSHIFIPDKTLRLRLQPENKQSEAADFKKLMRTFVLGPFQKGQDHRIIEEEILKGKT